MSSAEKTVASDLEIAQILRRDPQAGFVYGVTTTGVFCRPSCSSRRPKREHVRIFASAADASEAGFRPCLRCRPDEKNRQNPAMEKIRLHLETNTDRAVSLSELSRLTGLSPTTVEKQFKAAMGSSPLAYQRALRARKLRVHLKEERSVTDAIYAAGFSSSSRVYEDTALGMTPLRFAQGGRGERIGMGTAETSFGWMVVGATQRGLCWLSLASSEQEAEKALRMEFPAAEITRDSSLTLWIEAALAEVNGAQHGCCPQVQDCPSQDQDQSLEFDLRGTAFQLRVWEALRKIPRGKTMSYSQLAAEMGNPKSIRAVAHACAMNRVALLVPCHRVVGADGSLTGYRWGVERKAALLQAEKS